MNELISGLRGFTFNGRHNNDLGVVMHSKSIQSPAKKKIKDSVPFMSGSYDFSTIGSNGEISYSEREITITIGLPADTKERLQIMYSNVLEWLVDVGQQKLVFDVIKDYYFMAEVEDTTTFEEVMEFGQLEVKFVANPFKESVDYVGSDVWDTFNFEEDYTQNVSYDVVEYKWFRIYNPGRSIRPVINCTQPMTIIREDGKTYSLKTGDNKVYDLYLPNKFSSWNISGTGKISFIFRKESI